jgi:hypothetical protein
MPRQGRPRLTPEAYEARLTAYCSRYKVTPLPTGIPPFPAGRRETAQHREWIALYKAKARLARRERGQCEKCAAPVAEGSIFCEAHRLDAPGGTATRALLARQDGLCPICRRAIGPGDAVEHVAGPDRLHAALHRRCHGLAVLAATFDAEAIGHLRAYLWPPRTRARRL